MHTHTCACEGQRGTSSRRNTCAAGRRKIAVRFRAPQPPFNPAFRDRGHTTLVAVCVCVCVCVSVCARAAREREYAYNHIYWHHIQAEKHTGNTCQGVRRGTARGASLHRCLRSASHPFDLQPCHHSATAPFDPRCYGHCASARLDLQRPHHKVAESAAVPCWRRRRRQEPRAPARRHANTAAAAHPATATHCPCPMCVCVCV